MHYESTPVEKLDEFSEQFRSGRISARDYLAKFRDVAKHVPYDPAISLAAKALKVHMDFSAAKPNRVEETDRREAMVLFEAAIGRDTGGLAASLGAVPIATAEHGRKAAAELDALSERFAGGELSPSEYIEEFRETAARAPADPKQPLSAKALQIHVDFAAAPEGTVTDAHRKAAFELFAAALRHDGVPAGHTTEIERLVETSFQKKAKGSHGELATPASELRAAARAKAKSAPVRDLARDR